MNARSFTITVTVGLLGLVLALLLLLTGSPAHAHSSRWFVCPDGPPVCDFEVVQEAVDAASEGDIIMVATGDYSDVNNYAGLAQVVYISKTVTIRGGYTTDFAEPPDPVANPTSLHAHSQGRVLYVTGNISPTIEGLDLTGGVSESGGGIHNEGALTLRNCTIHDNHAASESALLSPRRGGGIYNEGALTLQDCIIHSNYAYGGSYGYGGSGVGGGIYNGISGIVTIQDTTLRENSASGGGGLSGGSGIGGGIHSEGVLVIQHSELGSNAASGGDGVFSGAGWGVGGGIDISASGSVLIEDSTLSENSTHGGSGSDTAEAGGAIGGSIANEGTLVIRRSVLSGNEAWGGPPWGLGEIPGNAYGGAIDISASGSAVIEDSTLSENSAHGGPGETTEWAGWGSGGSIANEGTLVIRRSLLSGNEAWDGDGGGRGGAILNYGTLTMENSTLSGNWAEQGGGLFDEADVSPVKISFCTIALNSADGEGGGLYSDTIEDNTGPAIKNTLIGDNAAPSGPDIWQDIQSRGYNLVEDTSGGTLDIDGNGNTAEGNIAGQDPRLGPLQDNGGSGAGPGPATWTHALLDDLDPSPAIDAGSSTDIDGRAVTSDQRGFHRPCPAGGGHDIGAYERGPVDVFMTKDVMLDHAPPGKVVTYTLVFGNASDMMATGVVISDRVPLSVTVTNVLSYGVTLTDNSAGPMYAWEVQNLLPGDGGVITITGELSALLTTGLVTNTATITTTAMDGNPANNSGTAVLRSMTSLYLPLVFKE
jgi:uncharacterized repeat protein (TIGR01451 family)